MLNSNQGNCFAKIGQAAFDPAHFVPGIGPSPDKMLQGRLFFLPNDTHRCRLGAYHTVLASQRPHAIQAGQLRPRRLDVHLRRWGNNYEDPIASAALNRPPGNPASGADESLDHDTV